MIRTLFTTAIASALLISCNNSNGPKHNDTSTSGKINISADESLKPIIEAQKDVFSALYPEAQLNIIYTNESDAIKLLSIDSARIAIVARDLNKDEKTAFEQKKIYPKDIVIGHDAIGLIMHPSRKDTVFTLEQIKNLLNGNIKSWKDLNASNSADAIKVVFDNAKSGAIRQLKDSLLNGSELSSQCYAVNTNPEVISRVELDKNTIGIIGVSWISDRDDSTTNNFLNRIRVASIVPKNPETAEARVMKPYQAYIALKQYPLYRSIHIINPEGRYGLGTGFASFINSDRGQRIILKSGLVPANAPVRIIQLKK